MPKTVYLQYLLVSLAINSAVYQNIGFAEFMRDSYISSGTRILVSIVNIFAVGLIFICVLGLLGILLTYIAKNRRYIGLHMAVGADFANVLSLVIFDFTLKRAFFPVLAGTIIVECIALTGASTYMGIPFSRNPLYGVACLVLTLAFLAAVAFYPAVIAARITPVTVLKGE